MSFVLLKTFSNYIEANIALSRLQQEGVNCHAEDENTVTILGMASGIRLMVYSSQAVRAAEILKEAELEYLRTVACQRCRQTGFDIRYVTTSRDAELRKLPFGGIIAGILKTFTKEGTSQQQKHYVCLHCGLELEEVPGS